MKKAYACLSFVVLSVFLLFAGNTWYVSQEVDDFGDPTGRFSVRIDDLSGTYKNSLTSNGNLKYSVEIDEYGHIYFYLLEGGKAVNLTTTSSGPYLTNKDEKLKIQIKKDAGDVVTYNGTLKKNDDYKYDVVADTIHDFRKTFIDGKSIKIVISATNGSYNLGTIDISNVSAELFYDRTLYDEGIELMAKGEYQKAIEKFNELKKKSENAFNAFNVSDSLKKSQIELGRIKYDEAKRLIEKKDYQKARDALIVIETLCPDEFQKLDAKNLKREIGVATGLWDVGSVGPAGGLVFYDKGFYSDGWRYLEAAPNELSFYNGKPTIATSNQTPSFIFSPVTYAKEDRFTYVNGTDEYVRSNCTEYGIGSGKKNTQLIVSFLKKNKLPQEKCAAYLCDVLSYNYSGDVYDDWFLPSIGELELLISSFYDTLRVQGISGTNEFYWSSSENQNSENIAMLYPFSPFGYSDYTYKDSSSWYGIPIHVLPIRAF